MLLVRFSLLLLSLEPLFLIPLALDLFLASSLLRGLPINLGLSLSVLPVDLGLLSQYPGILLRLVGISEPLKLLIPGPLLSRLFVQFGLFCPSLGLLFSADCFQPFILNPVALSLSRLLSFDPGVLCCLPLQPSLTICLLPSPPLLFLLAMSLGLRLCISQFSINLLVHQQSHLMAGLDLIVQPLGLDPVLGFLSDTGFLLLPIGQRLSGQDLQLIKLIAHGFTA